MEMYALVSSDGRTEMAGKVLSLHRTREAAEAADARLQRLTRKAHHDDHCWVETRIVRPARRVAVGYWLHVSETVREAE